MSQIPDGIGQIAYPLISHAGPPESGSLGGDTIYTLASTGQEQQLYNLTDFASSYVQPDYDLQQQQASSTLVQQQQQQQQQLYLQAESEQIELDYQQQAEEPQAQPDFDEQRFLTADGIRYLSYDQTGSTIEVYSEEQGQFDNEFHIPVAEQHQIPDYNQNLIEQPTQQYILLEPETETQLELRTDDGLEFPGEEQTAQPEQFSPRDSQYILEDQPEEEEEEEELAIEEDQYQAKAQEERRREQIFLDFANCLPEELFREPINRRSYLNYITQRVHQSLEFLRENCERIKEAEPEPEEERVQLQISGLSKLRERLVHVCPNLIDDPNPKAWTLLKEIILGIDCFTFTKQPGEGAAEVWKHNPSAQPADPMGLELLGRIRKIITGWYTNDTQADPDEAATGSAPAGDQQQQRHSRKRRIAEDEPPLIKYRRVDNSFPRFIPNEVGEEHMPNTYMAGRERDNQRQGAKRLSLFNSPKFTQRTVRYNAANINIDLSDDDEPQPSFGLGASNRPAPPTGHASMNPDSSNCPLPMRSQMLYSDAVRLGQNGFPESRMNGHPSTMRTPAHDEDSLLKREDRRAEHEQYLALLRNLCHDKSSIRAINNQKPPPLQLIYKPTERSSTEPSNTWRSSNEPSNTWRSILANNKPLSSRQQPQQPPSAPPPPPPQPVVSGIANLEFADYAKLLARQQQKITPPVPPLQRVDSAKSITSHASTISISESTSSSSNSSNASNAEPAINDSSNGQAAAQQANKT
ncbi:hypothetical protein KR032_002478 [Drosophila birchii]|nr:hypothetical protein KR032_002478 [Drosophila birchii]